MQQGTAERNASQPPHVLIVDDDADIRDVVGLLLTEDGFGISLCATVQQAMAIIEARPVHLLITDRRLSGGDGLDLIRYVHARAESSTRVILLTAARPAISPEEQPLIKQAGVSVVSKPFDIEQIIGEARLLTGWSGSQSS